MALAACLTASPAAATTITVDDGHVVSITAPAPAQAPRRHVAAPAKPKPVATLAPQKPAEPLVSPPRIDPAAPLSQPFYPAASRRFEEQGAVTVGVLVLPSGKVGDSWVEETSGYHRLDDAAVEEARRWRFIPATSGDQPVAAKKTVVVRFGFND